MLLWLVGFWIRSNIPVVFFVRFRFIKILFLFLSTNIVLQGNPIAWCRGPLLCVFYVNIYNRIVCYALKMNIRCTFFLLCLCIPVFGAGLKNIRCSFDILFYTINRQTSKLVTRTVRNTLILHGYRR